MIYGTKNLIFENFKSWVFDVVVPGFPVIGNLLQLKEKKPHKTFTRWSEIYGPIYSIKMGSSSLIVLNSTETAKEVSFLGLIDMFGIEKSFLFRS